MYCRGWDASARGTAPTAQFLAMGIISRTSRHPKDVPLVSEFWWETERSSECSFMVSSKLHTEYHTHHGLGAISPHVVRVIVFYRFLSFLIVFAAFADDY